MNRCALAGLSLYLLPAAAAAEPFSLARFHAELRDSPILADPLEPFNRRIFAINASIVDEVLRPTGAWLSEWTPGPVRGALANVYANLAEPELAFNNLMAGNRDAAWDSTKRFAINSTVGVLGIWDPASLIGLRPNRVAFTEALCRAGIVPGDYLVLPLVGPTNTTSAALLGGFLAAETAVFALISPALAVANIALDGVVAAASLRNVMDVPTPEAADPYALQRTAYAHYVADACVVEQSAGAEP